MRIGILATAVPSSYVRRLTGVELAAAAAARTPARPRRLKGGFVSFDVRRRPSTIGTA